MNHFFPLVFLLLLGIVPMAAQQPAAQEPSEPAAAQDGQREGEQPIEAWDPLLDLPPLPKDAKPTLVGGKVRELDRIRNRLTMDVFGGGRMEVNFDDRTHIYRDGVQVTQLGIREGDRVYLDTILADRKVFAKNIHVQTELVPADAQGQLLSYDRRRGIMTVRDRLSRRPVRFRVTEQTSITGRDKDGAASQLDLVPGALVEVTFSPDRANRGRAQEVRVVAAPGASFIFAGELTHLDLRRGVLAVQNRSDDQNYELVLDRSRTSITPDLVPGAEVTVRAVFDGGGYVARDIRIEQRSLEPQPRGEDEDEEGGEDPL